SGKVKVAAVAPADSHSRVVYPVAIIKDNKSPKMAREFVDFLSSQSAIEVFEKYGFTSVDNNSLSNQQSAL
ncbi:MAG: substrate-binding domain-containing protein, partial [Cyanobacteria bacterium J06649_11]